MSGVNHIIIIGRLGQDPEVRYTQSGDAVATLSVATSETWNDKATGEKKEQTEWHRIILWKKLAEIAGQYLKKGDQAYFEGKLQTRKWQTQDGADRYTTEIRANQMQMLGSGARPQDRGAAPAGSHEQSHQGSAQQPRSASQRASQPTDGPDYNDPIPF